MPYVFICELSKYYEDFMVENTILTQNSWATWVISNLEKFSIVFTQQYKHIHLELTEKQS